MLVSGICKHFNLIKCVKATSFLKMSFSCDPILKSSNTKDNNKQNYQFTQKTNPTTGKWEWVAETKDEHDYFTDIARSSYADMLHDEERNKLYNTAIRKAVDAMHSCGKKAKVLDIGTGTGLLSMMAARAGADTITAVEVFGPMAEVAKKVTKLNGYPQIKVINKHSTELVVEKDGDMQERANILVTELFDTELIGEGALAAYQHAHQHLMEEDCIAVPHQAVVKAVLVESPIMCSWNEFKGVSILGDLPVHVLPDDQLSRSRSLSAVHDIQLSQLPQDGFRELTRPFEVFRFDWGDRCISDRPQSSTVEVLSVGDGEAQVVFSWWDLLMDRDGDVVLSTAPMWHHPTPHDMQWRDHWLQSVYFLPSPFRCRRQDLITVEGHHDAYSLSFQASLGPHVDVALPDYPPRMLLSRPRLARLNHHHTNREYVDALKEVRERLPSEGVIVSASDFSLLPIIAAQLCPDRQVVAAERTQLAQRGVLNLARHNDADIEVGCGPIADDLNGRTVALLCGEPHFSTSLLPWHDLYFWYLRTELSPHLSRDAAIMPHAAHLCAAAVRFDDLWKIRAPVGEVEGFDVSPMDHMIDTALDRFEYHEAEPHALWEYPNILLSPPTRLLTFNFRNPVPDQELSTNGVMRFVGDAAEKVCHGVALWMEYDLDSTRSISTGLLPPSPCNLFEPASPRWCPHHKQGVFLFKRPFHLSEHSSLDYDVSFLPQSGDIKMKYLVKKPL